MFCYENINHVFGFSQGKNSQKDMWIPFMAGGLSKCIASMTLLPLNVVRMRLQMKKYTTEQLKKMSLDVPTNMKDQIEYKGVIDCFKKIYRNEGPSAFYKGLTPLVIKIFPSSGVFFLAYESTVGILAKEEHQTE